LRADNRDTVGEAGGDALNHWNASIEALLEF
jgi:hypothetical protein